MYTGTTLCRSSSQMALTGVTPLLTKVLNGDPPGVVILAGSINHVNAVADQLAASSSITKYPMTQFWPSEHSTSAKYLFNPTALTVVTTVPLSQKVCMSQAVNAHHSVSTLW